MKNVKKIVLAASLCAAMVATAAFGTLAYFTSTDEETNTFTVGDLAIKLEEPNFTPGYALKVAPNETIEKDPTISLRDNSVASYIRVVVEMPYAMYKNSNFFGNNGTYVEFIDQTNEVTFNETNSDITKRNLDENVKVVLDYTPMSATEDVEGEQYVDFPALFTAVHFSKDISNNPNAGADYTAYDELTSLEKMDIKITAYAVQQEGFASADEAFEESFGETFKK